MLVGDANGAETELSVQLCNMFACLQGIEFKNVHIVAPARGSVDVIVCLKWRRLVNIQLLLS